MKKILVLKSVVLIIMVLQDVTTTVSAKPTKVKTTKVNMMNVRITDSAGD